MALGGISFGSTKGDVRKIYGEPDRIESNGYVYRYSDSLYIKFIEGTEIGENQPIVYTVTSTGKNKIATPAGIRVGMKDSSLIEAYGSADGVGDLENGDVVYQYWDDNCTCLSFLVRDKKIIQITLYYYV